MDVLLRFKGNLDTHMASLSEDDLQAFRAAGSIAQGYPNFGCTVVPEMQEVGGFIVHRFHVPSTDHIALLVDFIDTTFGEPSAQYVWVGQNNGLPLHMEYVTDPETGEVSEQVKLDEGGQPMQNPYPIQNYHAHLRDPLLTQVNTIGRSRRL